MNAGKGCNYRPTNKEKMDKGYDNINWDEPLLETKLGDQELLTWCDSTILKDSADSSQTGETMSILQSRKNECQK